MNRLGLSRPCHVVEDMSGDEASMIHAVIEWFKHTHTHTLTQTSYTYARIFILLNLRTFIIQSDWLIDEFMYAQQFECNSFHNAFAKLTTCWRLVDEFVVSLPLRLWGTARTWSNDERNRWGQTRSATARLGFSMGTKTVFYVILCLQVLLCTQTHDF